MLLPKSKEESSSWSARGLLMLFDRSEHPRSQNVLHTSHANSFTDKEENSLCQTESPLIKILQTAAKLEKQRTSCSISLWGGSSRGPIPTVFFTPSVIANPSGNLGHAKNTGIDKTVMFPTLDGGR